MGSKLLFNLKPDDLAYTEANSRLQSKTKYWQLYRGGRITACVAHRVCRVKAYDLSPSLIQNICCPSRTNIRKKAILRSCEHEKDTLAS